MTGPAARYALAFRPAALRALRMVDRQPAERIKAATEGLRDDSRPPGAKMLGSPGLWRIRVADYRSCAPSMISDAWYALPPKALASADVVYGS